jgi:cytochrome c-type biogenesis protein CcmH
VTPATAGTAKLAATATARRDLWQTASVLAGLLVLVGGGLYIWQNAGNLQGFWLASQSGANTGNVPPMVFEMVNRLEKRLAEHPDDAEGWARLGRSYMVLERKDKALGAYARAYALTPDNVAVLSDYAWLVFNENPDVTSGLANTLYSRLYQLEPQHPDALWFMGFAAYQRGDYRQALVHWEKLLTLLPAEDPGRDGLKQAIAGARSKGQR